MREPKTCFLKVLIARDHAAALWYAHCLDLDLVAQGSTPLEAAEAIREAILLVVEDDLAHDLDPLERPRAPEECWLPFFRAIQSGTPVESLNAVKESALFACVMQVVRPHHDVIDGLEPDFEMPLPEAWQIAGLENLQQRPSYC